MHANARPLRHGVSLGALFLALLSPVQALADVVPLPPASCPSGAVPHTGHDGAGCVPAHCPVGSEGGMCNGHPCCRIELCGGRSPACAAGEACLEVRICAVPGSFPGGGKIRRDYREVTGYCSEMTGCPAGSACEAVPTCITSSGSTRATSPGRRGAHCACETGSPGDASTLPLLGLSVAALLARRRTRKVSPC